MGDKATIWHYPRCSKSRKTLAILRDQGLDITVRRYLDDPPSSEELADAVDGLDIDAYELIRTKEDRYKELDVDEEAMSDDDWLQLMADNPKLIQRPVVFTDNGVALGRPPENVYDILDAEPVE